MDWNKNERGAPKSEMLLPGMEFPLIFSAEDVRAIWPQTEITNDEQRQYKARVSPNGKEATLTTGNDAYDQQFLITLDIKADGIYYGSRKIAVHGWIN